MLRVLEDLAQRQLVEGPGRARRRRRRRVRARRLHDVLVADVARAVGRRQVALAREAAVGVDGDVAVLDQVKVVRALALDVEALAALEDLAAEGVDHHALLAARELREGRHLADLLEEPARLALRLLRRERHPRAIPINLGFGGHGVGLVGRVVHHEGRRLGAEDRHLLEALARRRADLVEVAGRRRPY